MPQVILGIFSSYRDAHDALRELQVQGFGRDDVQLFLTHEPEERRIGRSSGAPGVEVARSDKGEYAAHGEHLGTVAPTNHLSNKRITVTAPTGKACDALVADVRTRALLIVNMTYAMKPSVAREILHAYGAVAVKDPSGRWHFSPYTTTGRKRSQFEML